MDLTPLEPMTASIYDLRTGARLTRIPILDAPWSKTINEWGSLSVKLPRTPTARLQTIRLAAQPWRTLLVLRRGTRVIHSGVITDRPWDGTHLTLKAEGFGVVFSKRLVLNRVLRAMNIDGTVLIDEDNPAPEWRLTFTGSLVDIAASLIRETLVWGTLPVTLPAAEGGPNERTYFGYDFATVEKRLLELTQVENGPELRFTEQLTAGYISYLLEGAPELVNTHHQWNTAIEGQGVVLGKIDDDGEAIVTQQWMLGGRNEDRMLITRANGTLADYPLLQKIDSSHSTVSEIGTLRAYAREAIARGSRTQEVVDVSVPATETVLPGDWADVRDRHPYYGDVVLPLKVVGVSGSTGTRLKLSCRIRNGETVA